MLKFAFEQEDGGISEENPEVAISSWPMRGNPQRSGLAEKIETEISSSDSRPWRNQHHNEIIKLF